MIDIHTHKAINDHGNIVQIRSLYGDFAQAASGELCSLGVHPCYLQDHRQLLHNMEHFASLPNVLAVGECGLDTVCNKDADLQHRVFAEQVALAGRLGKPVIVHCVRAFDELLKVIGELKHVVPVVIHGYNKKAEVAEKLLAHNMYLSFGAAILNSASPAERVLKSIDAHRFFLETDDADVSITEIYSRAAAIRETGMDSLILQLQQNFKSVFKYQL